MILSTHKGNQVSIKFNDFLSLREKSLHVFKCHIKEEDRGPKYVRHQGGHVTYIFFYLIFTTTLRIKTISPILQIEKKKQHIQRHSEVHSRTDSQSHLSN